MLLKEEDDLSLSEDEKATRRPERQYENVDAADLRKYQNRTQNHAPPGNRTGPSEKQEHSNISGHVNRSETSSVGGLGRNMENLNLHERPVPLENSFTPALVTNENMYNEPAGVNNESTTSASSQFENRNEGISSKKQNEGAPVKAHPDIDFDDDNLSDEEDEVRRKVEFHRAEISKVLSGTTINKDVLRIHLLAVVQRYNVPRNLRETLWLATLYLHEGNCKAYRALLSNFKFDPSYGATENLTAYLLRAKAAYNLDDYSAAYKDCKRTISLSKKYSGSKDAIPFENCALDMAAKCAEKMGHQDDALYYKSLYSQDKPRAEIVMGEERTSIDVDNRQNLLLAPQTSKEVPSQALVIRSAHQGPATDKKIPKATESSTTIPFPPLFSTSCTVFVKLDRGLLTPSIDFLDSLEVKFDRDYRHTKIPSGTPELGFKSPGHVTEVLEETIIRDPYLAEQILEGRQRTSYKDEIIAEPLGIKFPSRYSHDVGNGTNIEYQSCLHQKYLSYTHCRFHILAILGYKTESYLTKTRLQSWASTKLEEMALRAQGTESVPRLYETLVIATALNNNIVARKMMSLYPNLAITQPPGVYSGPVLTTPLSYLLTWIGNTSTENSEDIKNTIKYIRGSWDCPPPGSLNLYHIVARHSRRSSTGMKILVIHHDCMKCRNSAMHETASTRAEGRKAPEPVYVTPASIIQKRLSLFPAHSEQEINVLKDMAHILKEAGKFDGIYKYI